MKREEIISGLQMTMDLIQFDPGTGNVRPIYELNDLDKTTYVACKEAIKALKAQGTCEDAVSRQTLQKELALYPIDDITSEDEAGYNRAINDVQKMVLHLPSAQPELVRCKDCKYYRDGDCWHEWDNEGRMYYQSVINEPNPDDYCSKAERKEE